MTKHLKTQCFVMEVTQFEGIYLCVKCGENINSVSQSPAEGICSCSQAMETAIEMHGCLLLINQ